ncbi:hypothetical protein EYR40_010846 [Pleurotus pulmonarius]|nr:hypothetical protein EYR36_002616 [Pleurotus pulmonarius]KAF4583390.1 hypothetical protein EYR38_002140 [Pleurotus pulmonarius]KAF4586830.1 hypothetical protein EYR40_010846 [Pleurotus pulmonarius]
MSTEHHAMRVNYRHLGQYVGKNVRLWGKLLRFEGSDSAIVEASDGGHITVQWAAGTTTTMTDTFIEVIGIVKDHQTIRLMACVNMGSNVDLKLANDTVELMHDPRFYQSMFAPLP